VDFLDFLGLSSLTINSAFVSTTVSVGSLDLADFLVFFDLPEGREGSSKGTVGSLEP
jgi:hypothetical protein